MANKGGFSWKRATGITRAKQSISRATGIPLTKSGRQRKVGKMVTGGGCILNLFLVIISIISIIILSFSLISCNGQSSSENKTKITKNETVEYKLATLYKGFPPGEDDPIVMQFKDLLDNIERKTINTRIDIADITVKAQELLKENGIERSLLQILNDFNDSIPNEATSLKLEEVASLYMLLMTD